MCDENYEILQPCYEINDENTCNSETLIDGTNRCEFRNGYCYSIPGLNTRDNCCIPREGYCINNLNENDYICDDIIKEITSSNDARVSDNNCCIDRVNYCIDNADITQYPDIDCSTENKELKNLAYDIKCENDTCDISRCCQDITNKCVGNTDPQLFNCDTGTTLKTGVCKENDTIIESSQEECNGTDKIWIEIQNLVLSETENKQEICCRELNPDEKCSGFFENNGCGNIVEEISTTRGYYNEKSNVDNEPIGNNDPIDVCCEERINYCKYNTNSNSDFDCSRVYKIYKNDPGNIFCEGDCTEDLCCETVTGMCINNTNQEDEPDIDCNFIGNYTLERDKVDHGDNYELCNGQENCGRMRDHPEKSTREGSTKSECCLEINHLCGSGSTVPFDCTANNTLPFVNKPPSNRTNQIECHDNNSNQTDCNNILLPYDIDEYLNDGIDLHPCCMEITNQCKGNTDPENNFDCGENRTDKINPEPCPSGGCNYNTCCEERTGYCGNNTDPSENFSGTCPEPSVLVPNKQGNTIEDCCLTSGQCFENDDSEDFDCESENMTDKSNPEPCPESGCTKEVCCNTVSRKCTGNTDSSKNVICSNLSENASLIENHEDLECNDEVCTIEECCEITGYCSGNTVNRDLEIPYNEDINENGQETYSINCDGFSSNPNRVAENKGEGNVGTTKEECCHITGYCYGNTDSSEDFDIDKCVEYRPSNNSELLTMFRGPRCSDSNIKTEEQCTEPNVWVNNQIGVCSDNSIIIEENCTEPNVWIVPDQLPEFTLGETSRFAPNVTESDRAIHCCNYIPREGPYFVPQRVNYRINTTETETTTETEPTTETETTTETEPTTERFTNMEGFKNMLIEGVDNNQQEVNVEEICNDLKNKTLESLGIDEEELIFTCVSENGIDFDITRTIIPKEGEELSLDIIEKAKTNINLSGFVSLLTNENNEDDDNTFFYITTIVIIAILISIIGYFSTK
tara:strand:- start:6878 stop:9799 length:2922 start_codon:yes stop_codon:yes gene_type:complete